MALPLSKKSRLIITIAISFAFFIAEIAVGFYTHSLALVADAFHYMNDLVGFVVALAALLISEKADSPQDLSFGWQRAQLLGAFFNGVFLLALGISIFLQSIERFISLQNVENPKLVLIVGCVGLALNLISATVLHDHDHGHGHGHDHSHAQSHSEGIEHSHAHADGEHDHSHEPGPSEQLEPLSQHEQHRHVVTPVSAAGHDLGMLGVFVHVIGDAINNIGVIIAAAVIWKANYGGRFYADPAVSMAISFMILLSALPLVKRSGNILLQSAPRGVNHADVKHDLEKIPGIASVHELHIWRLDQKKAVASAHLVLSDKTTMSKFMDSARVVSECLHAYGIHSATLQPELAVPLDACHEQQMPEDETLRRRIVNSSGCQISCGSLCEDLMCCK